MDFEQFSKKYRCAVSEKRVEIGHRQQRKISVKRYHIYINIKNMLPFNPKTQNDMLNCIGIHSDDSQDAKKKAFDMCKNAGAFD